MKYAISSHWQFKHCYDAFQAVATTATEASARDQAERLTAFAVTLAAFLFSLRLVAASRSGLFFDEA